MGRVYSIPFGAVASAATAAQDFFEVLAASGKPFNVHEISISQSSDVGDAAAEGLDVFIKRGITHTAGSGGTTLVVTPMRSNDPAAGVTGKSMNTTVATSTGGSLTLMRAEAMNEQAGWSYFPLAEDRPFFAPGEACVVGMGARADAITVSGTMVIEEFN